MMLSTEYRNAIAHAGDIEMDVPSLSVPRQFIIRAPGARRNHPESNLVNLSDHTTQEPPALATERIVVRVPEVRSSPHRITVLQRWMGQVDCVESNSFHAFVRDLTNSRNPVELVEFDISEVSMSDRPLVSEGATFYWSIGYRDSAGGQRERISSIRFARQPRIVDAQIVRVFDRADGICDLLERD